MKKSIYLILFAIIPLLAASTFKSSMRKGDEDLI
ncbi:MAG: hypothetical protein ACI85I_002859, partial [Arenicella sp.]